MRAEVGRYDGVIERKDRQCVHVDCADWRAAAAAAAESATPIAMQPTRQAGRLPDAGPPPRVALYPPPTLRSMGTSIWASVSLSDAASSLEELCACVCVRARGSPADTGAEPEVRLVLGPWCCSEVSVNINTYPNVTAQECTGLQTGSTRGWLGV